MNKSQNLISSEIYENHFRSTFNFDDGGKETRCEMVFNRMVFNRQTVNKKKTRILKLQDY